MKEIKFRAWSKVFNRFAPENAEYHFNGDDSHLHFDVFNGNFDVDVWYFSECDILQCTGLKDKNGVEIYEGDIVRDHNGIGEVQYSEIKAAFKVNYHDGFAKWFIDYNLKGERESIEVIGNIYENPELLESNNA